MTPPSITPTGREADALRVWWIPQIPMAEFHVPVPDIPTAILVLNALADYDLFQFKHRVKPDYSNAGGLEVFEDGEWCEWEDHETGDSIDDVRRDPELIAALLAARGERA